jgi:hypothetical protein
MRKTLREELPHEAHDAYTYPSIHGLLDFSVKKEHDGRDEPWPGTQRNVMVWWTLETGQRVGWNENPAIGWSFPVLGKARGAKSK